MPGILVGAQRNRTVGEHVAQKVKNTGTIWAGGVRSITMVSWLRGSTLAFYL